MPGKITLSVELCRSGTNLVQWCSASIFVNSYVASRKDLLFIPYLKVSITCNGITNRSNLWLKEYYVIIGESHPLSGFFSHTCWLFLQKCIANHETKQASKFQSDPSSNCFTIDVWTIKCYKSTFYFLLFFFFFFFFFCISFYTSSVVFCHVIFWE